MKKTLIAMMFLTPGMTPAEEVNPRIDYSGFVRVTTELEPVREKNRVDEDEFLRLAGEPGTVVLDTRSREKFEKLHVKGAVHLNFSDFSEESLAALIPDKSTLILIYCNNNFDNEPVHFAAKSSPMALNIPTFINLHGYGYTNVRELGPLLDRNTTRILFAGTSVLQETED